MKMKRNEICKIYRSEIESFYQPVQEHTIYKKEMQEFYEEHS